MAQRKEVRWSELKVGILALASMGLLTVVVFLITGQQGFFSEMVTYRAYSPDAGGLRTGALVRLAGVDAGNVTEVRLSGRPSRDETVEFVMEVNSRFAPDIRTDSEILMGTEGVLGDRYINISRGTSDAQPVEPGGVIRFRQTAEFTELVGGSRDLLDNLNVLTTRLNAVVETIENGEGTIGKFINDPALYNRLDTTVASAERLVQQISAGEGTLGQLVQSRELYDNINESLANLRQVADRIENGEGTVGKLIRDPQLYEDAQQLMARGTTLVDRGTMLIDNINQGQGTLGKLVTDDSLHTRVNSAVGNLDALLKDVREGDGTVTKLLHDPTLYNTLNSTSVEVREMIADFRRNPKQFLTIQLRIF